MTKSNLVSLYHQIMGGSDFASQQRNETQHFEFPSIYEETSYQTTTIEHLNTVSC